MPYTATGQSFLIKYILMKYIYEVGYTTWFPDAVREVCAFILLHILVVL